MDFEIDERALLWSRAYHSFRKKVRSALLKENTCGRITLHRTIFLSVCGGAIFYDIKQIDLDSLIRAQTINALVVHCLMNHFPNIVVICAPLWLLILEIEKVFYQAVCRYALLTIFLVII